MLRPVSQPAEFVTSFRCVQGNLDIGFRATTAHDQSRARQEAVTVRQEGPLDMNANRLPRGRGSDLPIAAPIPNCCIEFGICRCGTLQS